MYYSFEVGLISAAMNSGGSKPKPFHPCWLLRTSTTITTDNSSSIQAPVDGDRAEPEQASIRYSTDSESILKDEPKTTVKKPNLLKKLVGGRGAK